jgi:hypothetical protein
VADPAFPVCQLSAEIARRPGATDPAFPGKRTRMRHSQADRTGKYFTEMDRDNRLVWMNQPGRCRCPIRRVRHPQTGFSCGKGGIGPPFRLSGKKADRRCGLGQGNQFFPFTFSGWAKGNHFFPPHWRGMASASIFSLPTGGGGSGWGGKSGTSHLQLGFPDWQTIDWPAVPAERPFAERKT